VVGCAGRVGVSPCVVAAVGEISGVRFWLMVVGMVIGR
jgi:hypothetical protein